MKFKTEAERLHYEDAKLAYAALMKCYPFTLEDLPGEEWKVIPNYEDYHGSNYGRIDGNCGSDNGNGFCGKRRGRKYFGFGKCGKCGMRGIGGGRSKCGGGGKCGGGKHTDCSDCGELSRRHLSERRICYDFRRKVG